jgi:hypothetical protein
MGMKGFAGQQEGSALILVTLILLVLSVLGMALLGITMTNYMMNKAEREYQMAFYYAEMGTRKGMEQIKIELENFYGLLEAELKSKRPDDPPGPYETKYKSARFFSTIRDSAAANFKKPSFKAVGNTPVILQTGFKYDSIPGTPGAARFIITTTASIGGIKRTTQGNVDVKGCKIEYLYDDPDPELFENAIITGSSFDIIKCDMIIEDGPIKVEDISIDVNMNNGGTIEYIDSVLYKGENYKDLMVVSYNLLPKDYILYGNARIFSSNKNIDLKKLGTPEEPVVIIGPPNDDLILWDSEIYGIIYSDRNVVLQKDTTIYGTFICKGKTVFNDNNTMNRVYARLMSETVEKAINGVAGDFRGFFNLIKGYTVFIDDTILGETVLEIYSMK